MKPARTSIAFECPRVCSFAICTIHCLYFSHLEDVDEGVTVVVVAAQGRASYRERGCTERRRLGLPGSVMSACCEGSQRLCLQGLHHISASCLSSSFTGRMCSARSCRWAVLVSFVTVGRQTSFSSTLTREGDIDDCDNSEHPSA